MAFIYEILLIRKNVMHRQLTSHMGVIKVINFKYKEVLWSIDDKTSKFSSPDEPMTNLELKISASLKQALDKLKLSSGSEEDKKGKTFFWVVYLFLVIFCVSNRHKI
jgi:hypothetical protein